MGHLMLNYFEGLSLEALNAKLTTDSNLDPKEIKKAVEGVLNISLILSTKG